MHLLFTNTREPARRRAVPLRAHTEVQIGRGAGMEPGGEWGDGYLSRQHFRVWQENGSWLAGRIPPAAGEAERSPLYADADCRESLPDPCVLVPGQWVYATRRGGTAFCVVERVEDAGPPGVPAERTGGERRPAAPSVPPWRRLETDAGYDHVRLGIPYAVCQRLRVLQEELPRAIERWMNRTGESATGAGPVRMDEELLFDEVAGALRLALTESARGGRLTVAFLAVDGCAVQATAGMDSEVLERLQPGDRGWRFLNADPSMDAQFRPSRRVLLQVLAAPEPGTLLQWRREMPAGAADGADGTPAGGSLAEARQDWVLAMQLKGSAAADGAVRPLLLHRQPVVLYVACAGTAAAPPEDALPFLRTVGLQVSSLLETREHQRTQLQLGRYFSPRLRRLVQEAPETLEPVVFNCTVLFCDRRGSSLEAEAAAAPGILLDTLRANTEILGRVAQQVFDNEGAIADFAGDGVLGFWGWPPAEDSPEHALQAIETARRIAEALSSQLEPHPVLSREMQEIVFDQTGTERRFDLRYPVFRIGISTGDMAVGNVGLREQMKIGVFGGPVNFGARLEGLGKMFQLPVIVAEETRRAVGDRALLRRLCLIRPAGFRGVYPIYELVLPREHGGSGATPEQVQRYEEALDAFTAQKFGLCIRMLTDLVSEGDAGAVWLLKTAQDYQRNRPGPDWQGEVTAAVK